nr:MAG TPA_asm: hypothetical protein [Caudoviricetes sp.]
MAAACALAMDRGKRFCVWLSSQPAGCEDDISTRRKRGGRTRNQPPAAQ